MSDQPQPGTRRATAKPPTRRILAGAPGGTAVVAAPGTPPPMKPATVTVAKPGTASVAKPGTASVAKPVTASVAKPGTATIAKPATATFTAEAPPRPAAAMSTNSWLCLPPPLPFSRFALAGIALLLPVLAGSCWWAMRAAHRLAEAAASDARGPVAADGTLPPAAALVDDERFASAVGRWPTHEEPLVRARAGALAAAGDTDRALAAYLRLERLRPLGLSVDDGIARVEVLATAGRWNDALDSLARVDLRHAEAADRARAIAVDARCRLALRAAGTPAPMAR